jgi:hypothetical protein
MLLRMAEFQKQTTKLTIPLDAEDSAQQRLIHCWQGCKMAQPLFKTIWQFLLNLNIVLPYDTAIILLGI